LCDRQDVSLVVSDITMPVKTGLELLHELHDRAPSLPVIIITGQPSVEAAVECIRTGAVDFITKPFQLTEIAKRVGSTLEERRRRPGEDMTGTVVQNFSARADTPAGVRGIRLLGQGSMGTVYLVEKEVDDGNQYAMKVLRAEALTGKQRESALERFRREAEAAIMVNHPGVVRIFDYGMAVGDT